MKDADYDMKQNMFISTDRKGFLFITFVTSLVMHTHAHVNTHGQCNFLKLAISQISDKENTYFNVYKAIMIFF